MHESSRVVVIFFDWYKILYKMGVNGQRRRKGDPLGWVCLSASKMFDGLICTLGDGAGDSFCVTRPRWTIHLTTG